MIPAVRRWQPARQGGRRGWGVYRRQALEVTRRTTTSASTFMLTVLAAYTTVVRLAPGSPATSTVAPLGDASPLAPAAGQVAVMRGLVEAIGQMHVAARAVFLPLESIWVVGWPSGLIRHQNASASLILTPAMRPHRKLRRQPVQ